jgi:hypothetical protein
MYASDLINKDNKITKYYFAKGGRQISLNVYKDHFVMCQLFGKYKATKYTIESLDKAIESLMVSAKLIETIRYK